MKKLILCILFFTSIICLLGTPLNAKEENKNKYFGVGATIEQLDSETYVVFTEGKKKDEGLVFTLQKIDSGKETTFTIQLKGQENVYLKIEETDGRGRFIKEERSETIALNDNWRTYSLSITLDPRTEQIDVFVLTKRQDKTKFQFRNTKISY